MYEKFDVERPNGFDRLEAGGVVISDGHLIGVRWYRKPLQDNEVLFSFAPGAWISVRPAPIQETVS